MLLLSCERKGKGKVKKRKEKKKTNKQGAAILFSSGPPSPLFHLPCLSPPIPIFLIPPFPLPISREQEEEKTMEATKQWLSNYFPSYTLNVSGGIVNPTERLPAAQAVFLSLQHVLAMFGSTVVGPLLMGFNPNTALFFSGIGTILFFICTGGRVPSYVGSSFAFIGVVNSATGFKYVPGGPSNPNVPLASGGILVAGAIYFAVALIVMLAGHSWIEYIMPPVVTGAVVVAIGLNLAGAALAQASASGFDAWMSFTTVIAVALITMYAPGPLRRLPILLGGITGYLVHLILGYCGVGPGIDFTAVKNSRWFGMPPTHAPVFEGSAISLIAPVAVVLIVENAGHVKAVGAMTGHSLDKYMGRAFLGDAIATMVSAACGSTGVTTYGNYHSTIPGEDANCRILGQKDAGNNEGLIECGGMSRRG